MTSTLLDDAFAHHVWATERIIDECATLIQRAVAFSREHFEDMPEIAGWVWTETD